MGAILLVKFISKNALITSNTQNEFYFFASKSETHINTDLTQINDALTNDVGTSDLLQWAVQNYNPNSVVFAHYGGNADSKPSTSAGFIQVFGVTDSYIWIIAYSFDYHVYKRVKSTTWESSWTMIV